MTTTTDVVVSDPLALVDERLEAELCQLAADLAAGTARWLGLVAEYDRRQVWAQWECRSMADWLVWKCGVSLITARQYVQVARELTKYALLRKEFESGRLSYSRVRALCRCVTPETEAELVGMAAYTSAPQLERFAAAVERAKKQADPDTEAQQHAQRSLQLILDDDGTWIVRGRLPAEVGTALRRAIESELRRQDAADAETGMPPLRKTVAVEQRRVDSLFTIIEAGHVTLEEGGLSDQQSEKIRALIVVHRYDDGDELETGPAIPTSLADRLACDADAFTMTHKFGPERSGSGRQSSVGESGGQHQSGCGCEEASIRCSRRRRMPTKAARRALEDRDQCCRFPGCTRRRRLTPHHVREHSKNGLTTSSNLVMLCSEHHGLVHRNNWTIIGNANGELQFLPPNRKPIATVTGDIERIVETLTGPIAPLGWGDRFDLGHAVFITLHNQQVAEARRAQEAAPQTPTEQTPTGRASAVETPTSSSDAAASSTLGNGTE